MKKLGGFLAALAAVAAGIVASRGGSSKPVPPVVIPPPTTYTLTVHVYRGDPALDHKVVGAAIESGDLRAFADRAGNVDLLGLPAGVREVCASAEGYTRECKTVTIPAGHLSLSLEAVIPPIERIAMEGRFWTPRPVFASCLAVLSKDAAAQAAVLDEITALGFNGCRVFAGRLSWTGQSADGAAAALPAFLAAAAARGLYVYPSAVTDSKDGGYDVEAHLRRIAEICAAAVNCVLEAGNELGHPTQSDRVNDVSGFLALARRVIPDGVVWTLGSPLGVDEPDPDGTYPTEGGLFNDAHLDRGRDFWNQVRRLREIAGISEATKKPAMSGEPIGAAEKCPSEPEDERKACERAQAGKRLSDPTFFFTMGALCRGFEIGCTFHSEAGLQGQPLGPVQRTAAAAFVAGWKSIPTEDRLSFINATWAGSPVESADFTKVVRAYSFVSGGRGWTVLLGLTGDPAVRWGGGWRRVGVIAERSGVQVVEISR